MSELDFLFEMANLEPEETGLDFLIWVGPSPASHGPRVKVVFEPGVINPRNSFSVSIDDDPRVVVGQANISSKELNKIFEWVKKNKDVLLSHSRMEITDRMLRKLLKRIR